MRDGARGEDDEEGHDRHLIPQGRQQDDVRERLHDNRQRQHHDVPRLDPSTRAPALAGGPSLRMSPEPRRRVVLSERSESKDDGSGAPGLPGGLHLQWYPVDAEGFILPHGQATAQTRWVKLTGLERAAAPLRAGRLNTDERLRLALRVLATLRRTHALASHRLTELSVADPRELRFVLDDQLEVRCGAEADLAAHLERLRAAFKAIRRHSLAAGYIDVRFREPVVSPGAL